MALFVTPPSGFPLSPPLHPGFPLAPSIPLPLPPPLDTLDFRLPHPSSLPLGLLLGIQLYTPTHLPFGHQLPTMTLPFSVAYPDGWPPLLGYPPLNSKLISSLSRIPRTLDAVHDKERNLPKKSPHNLHKTSTHGSGNYTFRVY